MPQRADWDVVVVGGVNTDYIVRGPKLPKPGQTITGEEFHRLPGGKGANQAVAAARLGARVALVASVGADGRGDDLLAGLVSERVDTSHVTRDDRPSGVALVMIDREGEKQILTAPGANLGLSAGQVRSAGKAIAAARVLLVQLEVPLESVQEAIRIAAEADARVVLDPAPAVPLPDKFLQRVEVIRPNAAEAGVLTGIEVKDRDSRAAARALLERGVSAAVVGAEGGNLLVWPEGERWLEKLPVASVDATGAGDAFAATLAVILAEDRPLEEAATYANAAAALATTKLGAQTALPRHQEVEELVKRYPR
jgi:ribokinase